MCTAKLNFDVKELVQQGRTTIPAVKCLRAWLNTTDYPRLSNGQIIVFLIANDNDHDKTKETITAHFHLKSASPKFFQERNVLNRPLLKIFNDVYFAVLPERLENSALILVALKNDDFNLSAFFRYLLMSFESVLYDDPPTDLILIADVKGVDFWKHFGLFKLGLINSFLKYARKGLPLKLRKLYVLNASCSLWAWSICAFKNVEHFALSQMEEFYLRVPIRCLPREYGGQLGTLNEYHENNFEKLKGMQRYFNAEMQQRLSSL